MSKQGVKKYFFFIKKQVSSDWKDLAECLDFETPDIENIEGKCRDDKSRCMELLQQWYKQKGNAATIHVLMEALQEADLKHVVDSLKDKYPELHNPGPTVLELPVHLQLGLGPQTSAQGGISKEREEQLLARILELERTMFTVDVLRDRRRYEETRKIFLSHKALLKKAVKGSILLLLTFLRQTDVDRFYHNHYRVGEGTLSQQLSHILISDDLQDKVKGAQLLVRLQVKHEDYVRVRNRLGQGLDRTTSVDNLLTLLPPSRHVDHSSLRRGLDLAVIDLDGTDDITMLYRQVQTAVHTVREKSKLEVELQLEMMQLRQPEMMPLRQPEMNPFRQVMRSVEGRIEETNISPSSGEVIHSEATNTGEVKQSVVQGFSSTGVERSWVKKVSYRGKFARPFGVAVSKDNEVYIADCLNSRIQVFTMDGVHIREFTTTLPGETGENLRPHDVAVDRNDNLWVVGDKHVVQYSREGTCLVTIDMPHVGRFHGITVSMATEQVIVTEFDGQNGQLQVFNQDGSEVGTYGSGHRAPEPWWPRYVTVDGEGNILVTDYSNHCVHVLDREGNFKFQFGSEGSDESQLKNPQGICVDGMGNIIVADYGNGCVKMFDSQSRFLSYIVCGMEGPQAVTVSPGGDVVVTDGNHTVSVWTQEPRKQKLQLTASSTGVGQRWVKKVSFGGRGSGRWKFLDPSGVTVSKDNEVYIADCGNCRIQVFTIGSVYIREFTTTLPGETGRKLKPWDVSVDRNDNLWVVSDKHVVQYSREGTRLATIDLPHVGYHCGIAVAMATEQMIVTEYDGLNGRLRVFNQDGSKVGTYGSGHRSPEPWWPQYVTVDGEGNILVTDGNNHCVHVLDREGSFKFKFGSEGSHKSRLANPQGICVDGKGNTIVADNGHGCVKMFDSQGRFLCHIGSGMEDPMGVTVSPGGDVVVTDIIEDTVSVWAQC